MTNKELIILSIANGSTNLRAICDETGLALATVYHHTSRSGDLIRYEAEKDNTLRLGPNVAIVRRGGVGVRAYAIERDGFGPEDKTP